MTAPPDNACARSSNRTNTRTLSHSKALSLGARIGAAVTVLSIRSMSPRSTRQAQACCNRYWLICAQVVSEIWLITLCSAAFLGTQPEVSRAKVWHDSESSRQNASSS